MHFGIFEVNLGRKREIASGYPTYEAAKSAAMEMFTMTYYEDDDYFPESNGDGFTSTGMLISVDRIFSEDEIAALWRKMDSG